MKKIDTILFDFDGTIMNTNELILRSWQHTFMTLANREGDEAEILRSYGEPIDSTVARFFPDHSTEEVVQAYRAYHYDSYERSIELFPGVTKLLKALKTQEYALGVVTSRLYSTAKIGMDKFRLFDYFDAFVTVKDTEKPKPDPSPILLALEQLGRTPERTIMVGDTKHDIECARNAGVISVLVAWSLAVPPDEYEEVAADYIIEEANDLLGILNDLNGFK